MEETISLVDAALDLRDTVLFGPKCLHKREIGEAGPQQTRDALAKVRHFADMIERIIR